MDVWKNEWANQNHLLAHVYLSFSQLYLEQSRLNEALEFAELSLRMNHLESEPFVEGHNIDLEDYSLYETLLKALIARGRIYTELSKVQHGDNLQKALKTYQVAADVIEAYRLSFKNNDSKLLLAEQMTLMYEEAIQVAHQLFRNTGDELYLNAAFQFAERGKGTVLLDIMHEAEALRQAGIPDSLLSQEKELRLLLAYHDKNLKSELMKGNRSDEENVRSYKQKLFGLKQRYDDLLQTFEITYPEYYDLKYRNYTATINEVTEQLLGPDELLVEYVVGADSLYIILLSESVKGMRAVSVDSTFKEHVEGFKNGLAQRNRELYIPSAYKLYSVLVEPVFDIIPDKKKWVIVADDVLNGIPFGALITGEMPVNSNYYELPYLIYSHSFRYSYSATLELSQMALRKNEDTNLIKSGQIEKKDFLAFAPVFKEGFMDWKRGAEMLEDLRPDTVAVSEWGYLPQSKEEVVSISSMFRQDDSILDRLFKTRSTVYLNKHASEHTLKSIDLSTHRYLHFATHGIVNKAVPELSGIILAQDTTGGEDGILHLNEVYNLDLDADLVVLSACQTGVGKMAKGEGLMSLTRGFMYAGADAILASYWQVADGSTHSLMVSFYDYLLEGEPKTESLRRAKLDLINKYPQFAHPYYWASFVLIGR